MVMRKSPPADFLNTNIFREIVRSENRLYHAFIGHYEREYRVAPHYHPELEIVIPSGIGGEAVVASRKYRLLDNHVYLMRPGAVHSFSITPHKTEAKAHILQINMKECARLIAGFGTQGESALMEAAAQLSIEPRAVADDVLRAMHSLSQIALSDQEHRGPLPVSAMIRDCAAICTIMHSVLVYARKGQMEKKRDVRIRKILDVIQASINEPMNLDKLAQDCAVSKFHLCRIFKKATGMTIKAHCTHLRVNHACMLLASGEKNVTEASYASGFENVSYFIQVFKKCMGVSPKQWAMKAGPG